MAETKRERLVKLHNSLTQEFQSFWLDDYRTLADYILPSRARFLVTDKNRSGNGANHRRSKIIDPSASMAARTQAAGMFTGITSPARPWFRLRTANPDLMESEKVKDWLFQVENRMRDVMLRSNLYNALPTLYGDIGTFATGAFVVLEDARTVFRCFPLAVGSYRLAQNDSLRVDTLTREYTMTVRQMVDAFGSSVSPTVKSLYDTSKYEETVPVTHIVGPNLWKEPGKLGAKNMPVASSYFETQGNSQTMLKESGFEQFPVLAPRWEVTGEDTYGSECPGMTCIGDVKALQTLHKNKAKAAGKMLDPPLVASDAMRTRKVSQLPGDVTFVAANDLAAAQVKPLHEVRFEINPTLEDIRDHQQRISTAYYADLFLMLAESDRRQITAREIDERHDEKMLMLGPVMERLNSELLDPLVDRVFAIMLRRGLLPPPPDEMQGQDLQVEYISIMAQAQKLLGASGIERLAGFVGNLAGGIPEAIDKFDADQAVDEYGAILGVPPRLIRSDDQVAVIRGQRAKAQQQQAQLAAATQAAQGAQVLSQTDTSRDNALTRILGTTV